MSVDIPKDWIRENAEDIATVLDYLKYDVTLFQTILVSAKLFRGKRPLIRALEEGESVEKQMEPHRNRVHEWLYSGNLTFCPSCLTPVLEFVDGKVLSWPPDEVWHQCIYPSVRPPEGAVAMKRPELDWDID